MASLRIVACASPCRAGGSVHSAARPPRMVKPASWTRQRSTRVLGSRRSDMRDSDPEMPHPVDAFDQECADTVIRVLTAKAVQRVLLHLGDADSYSARWLNNYCNEHAPLEGNDFITKLMKARPTYEIDPYTGMMMDINPLHLANRIMATRDLLIKNTTLLAPEQVAKDNVKILRRHLEAHTYVSGSSETQKPSYRAYRNPRNKHQWDEALEELSEL